MENSVFISEYLEPNLNSLSCIIKARYSDFHVTEILPDGSILKQESPLPTALPELSSEVNTTPLLANNNPADMSNQSAASEGSGMTYNTTTGACNDGILQPCCVSSDTDWRLNEPWKSFFEVDPDNMEKMHRFVEELYLLVSGNSDGKSPAANKTVSSYPIADKKLRTSIHSLLKWDWHSNFELRTSTDPKSSSIIVTKRKKTTTSIVEKETSPKYFQFLLYKENRSTMEAVNKIAFLLRKNPKGFSFAGTKDKRAVTLQRVVMSNFPPISVERLLSINKDLKRRGIWISDIRPCDNPLLLGTDLGGNLFSVFLRDLQTSEILPNILSLKLKGFINYYGMQRFGTGGTEHMTHLIGIEILKEDWKKAVQLIMAPRREGEEDPSVHQSRCLWKESPTPETSKAIHLQLPHWMVAERAILSFFSSQSTTNDHLGAIQKIPHEMKMMYVHAVQSLIWNFMASERIKMGRNPMIGDLVSRAPDFSDLTWLETQEELKSASIEDLVLPLAGSKIKYPKSASLMEKVSNYVQTLFGSTLTLESFGLTCKVCRLDGAYRRLIAIPRNLEFELIEYHDPEETILRPLFENIASKTNETTTKRQKKSYLGLRLQFMLPASSYATMALRELTRIDTSASFQKGLVHLDQKEPQA